MSETTPNATDPLVSLGWAAEYLSVDTQTVRRLVKRGELPAYRLGGSRTMRVRLSDVDAILRPVERESTDERYDLPSLTAERYPTA